MPSLKQSVYLLYILLVIFMTISQAHAEQIDDQSFTCASPLLKSVDDKLKYGKKGFDLNVVASTYSLYSAASSDAYAPSSDQQSSEFRAFHIADDGMEQQYGRTNWLKLNHSRYEHLNGLSYDVYYQSKNDRFDVLVAYRGTDGLFNIDTLANLSWITQWINPWDQYRQARNEFKNIMLEAIKIADGKPVAFMTTGHSLGGGLAQHVAHAYPCTSAIVFNSSFVTNTAFFKKYQPVIVKVYEEGDLFEFFSMRVVNDEKYSIYRFPIELTKNIIANHNIEKIAAGMSRWTLESCRSNTSACYGSSRNDLDLASTLFCERYIKYRFDSGDTQVLRMKERSLCPSHSDMRADGYQGL